MTTLPPKRAAFSPRNLWKSPKGFSLVEVTLALGVTAVALITLLGMVPVGLNTFRTSIETTVRTDITRRIIADLQQTPFSSIASSSSNYFFTDEGIPTTGGASDSIFKVNYSVSSGVSFPGNTTTAALKKITVLFYTQQDQAKNGPATYTNVVYVADNGF